MIIDLIVGVLFGILNAVLDLLPEYVLFEDGSRAPTGEAQVAESWVGWVAGWLRIWDLFVPVSHMFLCIIAIFTARVFVGVVQFVQWVWSVLPFKSS